MSAVIVLPTYNERENLRGIVSEILAVVPSDVSILIVDDNSPDGTGKLADELSAKNAAVSVLHRSQKEGLGRAYVAGFTQALSDPSVEYVFEMDADFSHQPKYLPRFLDSIQDADLVLGSRYMEGGGVENWDWLRRFISWSANRVIRLILSVPVTDLTGGYKCFRRNVLEELKLDSIESNGYNFQIEVNYRAYRAGYNIREIPIVFVERRAGQSKFNVGIMFESFAKVLRLRFSKY